ncbi:MAG: hypothetical protein PHD76_01360 [Methylacidiphilales bacterium]|nr:hypothetical protein [Candidatus Methylacidiphilales bacterium]
MSGATDFFAAFVLLILGTPIQGSLFGEEQVSAGGKTSEQKTEMSVQIVNATCVPEIAVWINNQPAYPRFPRGLCTSDAPVPYLKAEYKIRDLKSGREAVQTLELENGSSQTLLLLGDFKVPRRNGDYLESLEEAKMENGKKRPNVAFMVLPHALKKGEKLLRYRVVNGMPGQTLELLLDKGAQHIPVAPGGLYTLERQPPVATLDIEVGGSPLPVLINQERHFRNCTIVFYKTEQGPSFVRVFENTGKSHRNQESGDETALLPLSNIP